MKFNMGPFISEYVMRNILGLSVDEYNYLITVISRF
jgi:hypothetical protein